MLFQRDTRVLPSFRSDNEALKQKIISQEYQIETDGSANDVLRFQILNKEKLNGQQEELMKELKSNNDFQIMNLEREKIMQIEKKNGLIELLQRQIKLLKKFIQSKPSKSEDINRIKELQREIQQMKIQYTQKDKLLNQSTEIIKYLQLEQENYKKTYNFFNNNKEVVEVLEVNSQQKFQQFKQLEIQNFQKQMQSQVNQLLKIGDSESQFIPHHPNKRMLAIVPMTSRNRSNNSLDYIDLSTQRQKDEVQRLNHSINYDTVDIKHHIKKSIQLNKLKGEKKKRKQFSFQAFENPADNINMILQAEKFVQKINMKSARQVGECESLKYKY